jgi:hypothetical protein
MTLAAVNKAQKFPLLMSAFRPGDNTLSVQRNV